MKTATNVVTDHIIKNCPQWEIKWKKERAERRNRKKERVHPKKNKESTKAMVAAWGESSNEDSKDEDGDEQALMDIGESDEESKVSVIHFKEKIKFLSKESLSELLLDFIDESEVINNEKEQLSKECVILKANCKNLELRASESDIKNIELKNQVLELDTTVLELRPETLKLRLGIGKKKADHTYLTLEENLGKMKDELYKRDEHIRVLKEYISKVKHELDRTCKWNKSSDALSWLQEYHGSNKRGFGYGTPATKWDPKSKYITLPKKTICTHCGKTGHYKSECTTKEKVQVKGSSQIWYMDNGCSKHMTGSKNQFLSLEDLKGGNVSLEMVRNVISLGLERKIQKKLGNQLASIRSDHGTEFKNSKFAKFCDKYGIDHNFSSPRTPQQNGVVERKNRTLEYMARTMLLSSKLPHSFWAEAINTAYYIINRCITRPLVENTPYELLKRRKSNISHIRAFGCKYFAHNNRKDSLGKFYPRSDKGVFLGYSSHSKAYKVYNKRTMCVEESIHVVLYETNILSERHAHRDEAVGLVKGLNEITAQAEDAPKEGTCSSI
ncbi:uncharacterized protein [Nicotiana sylvestris]|uniref:uncharacterized protein n=1 Tax=Nicotiana sylvestris TaxID=4096 RepID=UPI00388C3C4C